MLAGRRVNRTPEGPLGERGGVALLLGALQGSKQPKVPTPRVEPRRPHNGHSIRTAIHLTYLTYFNIDPKRL